MILVAVKQQKFLNISLRLDIDELTSQSQDQKSNTKEDQNHNKSF